MLTAKQAIAILKTAAIYRGIELDENQLIHGTVEGNRDEILAIIADVQLGPYAAQFNAAMDNAQIWDENGVITITF